MIHSLGTYFSKEIWVRRRELGTDSHLWIAAVLGVVAAILGEGSGLGEAGRTAALGAVLAYAAIAFGFSLAGLTVAITVPDEEFTKLLATEEMPATPASRGLLGSRGRRMARRRRRGANAFLDLLFVFSWTALAHWLTIAWSIGLLVACGTSGELLPEGASVGARIGAGGLAFFVSYSILQFLLALLTLSSVGRIYVLNLRQRAATAPAAGRAEPPADSTDRPSRR